MSTVGPPISDSPEAGTSIFQAALQKEEINFCYESGVNFEPLAAAELRHGNDCHRDSLEAIIRLLSELHTVAKCSILKYTFSPYF